LPLRLIWESGLASVPGGGLGQHLEARADSRLVKIFQHGHVLREHPRQPPGGRSTYGEDLPEAKRGDALRDIDYLKRQAAGHGEQIGIYAARLLDDPLPWTRMRKVYKLLSLVKRFGAERVKQACRRTLDLEVVDVTRVQRILERALEQERQEAGGQLRLAPILRPRFARCFAATNSSRCSVPGIASLATSVLVPPGRLEQSASTRTGGPLAGRSSRRPAGRCRGLRHDPEEEALAVYATDDAAHPGVALLKSAPTCALAGRVVALARPSSGFARYDLTPAQVRQAAAERGWKSMVGFQTRNPVHRAHEYLQKVALEVVDGLLLHPLVGETKSDDIPAAVRMACYEALFSGYYPAERVLLATNPAWMRYAGTREAVFHAILRRNYGCTHFIVGRDHAGVGSYYDTYAAHRIFDGYAPGELGIEILRFDNSFFCRVCGGIASTRTCPHPAESHATLSGTAVRECLARGEELPAEFTRPEVAA
jgi:hypothetical protein